MTKMERITKVVMDVVAVLGGICILMFWSMSYSEGIEIANMKSLIVSEVFLVIVRLFYSRLCKWYHKLEKKRDELLHRKSGL